MVREDPAISLSTYIDSVLSMVRLLVEVGGSCDGVFVFVIITIISVSVFNSYFDRH